MKSKHAAIEMTMGTIVTIVLMVAILIVILFFVNQIRDTGTNAISGIDQAIQNQVNELFTDNNKKVIIVPVSREINLEKGSSGSGVGFSIKNVDSSSGVFSYEVSAKEIASDCSISKDKANSFISLGRTGQEINIPSGSAMDNAIFVDFKIPESATLCEIRYGIDIQKDGDLYTSTIYFDLNIK